MTNNPGKTRTRGPWREVSLALVCVLVAATLMIASRSQNPQTQAGRATASNTLPYAPVGWPGDAVASRAVVHIGNNDAAGVEVKAWYIPGDPPEPVTDTMPAQTMPAASPADRPVILIIAPTPSSYARFDALALDWAAHGYIVLAVDRQSSATPSAADTPAGQRQADTSRPASAGELASILDSLTQLPDKLEHFPTGARLDYLGVVALGDTARQTVLLCGAKLADGTPEEVAGGGDPRVRAMLLISPLLGNRGTALRLSWDAFNCPAMFMLCAGFPNDTQLLSERGEGDFWRREPGQSFSENPEPGRSRRFGFSSRRAFEDMPPGGRYMVSFQKVGADALLESIPDVIATDVISEAGLTRMLGLAFWDSALRGSREASEFLQSDAAPRLAEGGLTYEHK